MQAGLEPAADDEDGPDTCELTYTSSLSKFAVWIILGFLAIGATYFAYAEGWHWMDSLYFCVVTLLTVGYGDYVPTSAGAKVFTIVYILVGLSLVATSLGIVFSSLQSTLERDDPAARSRARSHLRHVLAALGLIGGIIASGAMLVYI